MRSRWPSAKRWTTRRGTATKSHEELCIDVQYIVDREKVTITVSDEGEGFDTEVYLSRGVSGNPVDAARERTDSGGCTAVLALC